MSRISNKILNWILLMIFSIMMLLAMTMTANAASDDTVTREEWMTSLETTYELEEDDISTLPEEFFSDPEAPATREFAATTVNYFIGFELNQGLGYSFTDAADVTDKDSAEYAVIKELLTLEDGKFSPEVPITVTEKDIMLPAAKSIWQNQYSVTDSYGDDAIAVSGLLADYSLNGVRRTLFIPNKLHGKTVKYITDGAYKDNTGITLVRIPNTVETIGSNVFSGCSGINKVVIPVDIHYTNAPFNNCTGVTEIQYTYGQTGIMPNVSKENSNTDNRYTYRLEFSVRDTLEKVSFEEGITRIGNGAYYFAPESYNQHKWPKLKTVELPTTLKEIGSSAFCSCTALSDIMLPEGLTTLGTSCFNGCTSIGDTIQSIGMPASVTAIPDNCFNGCTGLTGTLVIPDQITEMGRNAFNGCTGITKVDIPVDIHYTNAPFNNCTGVTEIRYRTGQTGIMPNVSKENSNTDNRYTYRLEFSVRDTLEKVSFEEGITRIGNGAYYFAPESYNQHKWPKLKTVELPTTLKEIGSSAFCSCTALSDITLPEGLTTLGTSCFNGCTSIGDTIQSIGMPASVTAIPDNCFNGCTGLNGTLIIPDQIIEMGSNAFNGCTGITKVDIPVDFKYTYAKAPFSGCTGVTEIRYRTGQTGIMPGVTKNNNNTENHYTSRLEFSVRDTLEKVSFEEGITRIGNGAYYFAPESYNQHKWPKLKTVELPTTLKEIGSSAFCSCTALSDITLPEGLTTLGTSCFNGCTSIGDTIQSIGMPASVTAIPDNCFNGCTGLTGTLVVPDQITEMGSNAFNGCTGVTKVDIPVDFHYTNAPFNNCTGVTEIRYREGQTGIMPNVSKENSNTDNRYTYRLEFSVRDTLEKVSFDEGITRIGNGAYYFAPESYTIYTWPKLDTVILPESLEEIGDNAFRDCTALAAVILPGSTEDELAIPAKVMTIGANAFSGCNELDTIRFYGSMPQIGSNAFRGITATAYYPRAHSESWTEEGRQNYGGTLIWYQWPKIKAETPAQPTVTENGITENSVTLTAIVGYEYGILNKDTDEIDWGQENIFNSLSPKTEYTFYQRVEESPEYYASDSSEGLTVRTLKTAAEIEADQAAADSVTNAVEALPTEVTVGDKAVIEAARAAYEALTDDQKALVSDDTLQKLTEAEDALAAAEDQAAADSVTNAIEALPTEVTVGDKTVIEAARAEYEALTDNQKALVSEATLQRLIDAEAALAAAEAEAAEDQAAADSVTNAIEALPTEVTVGDKAVIEAARAAYEALTDDQKALVSDDTLQKLTEAEDALAAAEDQAAADSVTNAIEALPTEVTVGDKAVIEAARAAYEALTDDQKALVSTDTFKILTDAEAALAAAEAAAAEADKSDTTAPPAATGENVIVDLKAVKISKPTAAKKAATVKWKKVGKKDQKKIQGIEIQISTDSGFQNIVKNTTAGKKKTSKKIKGLMPKTKYWVRIRAYRNDGAGKHVSAWKKKTVKVK